MSYGHGHSHGAGNNADDHAEHHTERIDEDDLGSPQGELFSLYRYVNADNVVCLNEQVPGSVKGIFKPWDKRLDTSKFVSSDADAELLITIPFTGVVKLKSATLIGGANSTAPGRLRLFANRDDLDFNNVGEMKPLQEIALVEDPRGEIEWPLNTSRLSNVSVLIVHVPCSLGAERTCIYYLGLKGDFAPLKREAVVANYELRPQAAGNKALDELGIGGAIH